MNPLLSTFQNFKQILCLCPCCGELHRLSDLHLRARGQVKKTWLDDYSVKEGVLQKREDSFLDKEKKLREIAREKGRKAAEVVFNQSIAPEFKKMGLNPYDIKPVMHPIDFMVFKGMNSSENVVNDIMFLSQKTKNKELNAVRKTVKDTIKRKDYEWKVARVDDNGEMEFE